MNYVDTLLGYLQHVILYIIYIYAKGDIIQTLKKHPAMSCIVAEANILYLSQVTFPILVYERKDTKHHNNNVDNVDNKLNT